MLNLNASIKLSANASAFQFSEVQKFRQFWVWGSFVLAFCLLASICVYQLATQTYIFSFSSLAWVGIVLSALFVFVHQSRLDTKIDRDGIQYKFFPVHLHFKKIMWEQIEEAYVRRYDALTEYGGLGARYGNRGNAYIVSGKYGLQLSLSDGRKILISTHRPMELERIILQLLYNYEVK